MDPKDTTYGRRLLLSDAGKMFCEDLYYEAQIK